LSYLEQAKLTRPEPRTNAFFSCQIEAKPCVAGAIDFLSVIAKKLLQGSHEALSKYRSKTEIQVNPPQALHFLLWWN